tara:strand:+ start:7293 stop:7841 length:549 start_codon:yes stop_codon:yes gene_type:complete
MTDDASIAGDGLNASIAGDGLREASRRLDEDPPFGAMETLLNYFFQGITNRPYSCMPNCTFWNRTLAEMRLEETSWKEGGLLARNCTFDGADGTTTGAGTGGAAGDIVLTVGAEEWISGLSNRNSLIISLSVGSVACLGMLYVVVTRMLRSCGVVSKDSPFVFGEHTGLRPMRVLASARQYV